MRTHQDLLLEFEIDPVGLHDEPFACEQNFILKMKISCEPVIDNNMVSYLLCCRDLKMVAKQLLDAADHFGDGVTVHGQVFERALYL